MAVGLLSCERELLADRRCCRLDEMIFAEEVATCTSPFLSDDLEPFRDQVGVLFAEPVDGVREAEVAVLNERSARADMPAPFQMLGDELCLSLFHMVLL